MSVRVLTLVCVCMVVGGGAGGEELALFSVN